MDAAKEKGEQVAVTEDFLAAPSQPTITWPKRSEGHLPNL